MNIESALRSLVLQNADVVTQFGSRFHWDHLPDDVTYPCIRATTITDPKQRTHHSTHGGRANVQLDVYDDDKASCNTAADVLETWLDNYRGALGTGYTATIQVKAVRGGYEADARLFRRIIEAEILYFKNF